MSKLLFPLSLLPSLLAPAVATAQEAGTWRPLSTTARSITGEVVFSKEKISLNFNSFPLLLDRALQPAEVPAIDDGADPTSTGHLFRLGIPASKQFLHKNTMCGSDAVQWLVTVVSGKTLQLAFFSGAQAPTLTVEAINNTTSLCGTYTYTR